MKINHENRVIIERSYPNFKLFRAHVLFKNLEVDVWADGTANLKTRETFLPRYFWYKIVLLNFCRLVVRKAYSIRYVNYNNVLVQVSVAIIK